MTGPAPVAAIDLTEFAAIINEARTDNNTCLLGTSLNNVPDVGLKGSMMVWDKDHLAYWERTQKESLAGLKANPNVCVFVRNPTKDRRTLRLLGTAQVVEDVATRERIWERVVQVEKDSDKEKKGLAVMIRIDRVRGGPGDLQKR